MVSQLTQDLPLKPTIFPLDLAILISSLYNTLQRNKNLDLRRYENLVMYPFKIRHNYIVCVELVI